MKKSKRFILIMTFICGICLPVLLWKALGPVFPGGAADNRTLARRPVLGEGELSSFSKDYEAYFNDHLPFREALIGAGAMTDFLLFRSSSDRVIAGADGWLFYSVKSDGDPVADYMGETQFSDMQLSMIAENCAKIDTYMKEKGGTFVIFITPNKERVYHEYMPVRYGEPAQDNAISQLCAYLEEKTDVKVISCLEGLEEAKEKTGAELYYKTDTHWNQAGAYVGSSILLKGLGVDLPVFGEDVYPVAAGTTCGDLARFLHLAAYFDGADKEYDMDGFEIKGERHEGEGYHSEIRYTCEDADPRRVYICRDSFGDAMVDYIGSCFSETEFVYQQSFDMEEMKAFDPDIFIYEATERYLPQIAALTMD